VTSTFGATNCALDARDGVNWINRGVDRFPVLMPDRLPVPHTVCRSAKIKYAMKADCVEKTMVWVLLAVLLRCFFRRRRRHDFLVPAIGPRPIFSTDTVEIVDFLIARIFRRWSKLPARRILYSQLRCESWSHKEDAPATLVTKPSPPHLSLNSGVWFALSKRARRLQQHIVKYHESWHIEYHVYQVRSSHC